MDQFGNEPQGFNDQPNGATQFGSNDPVYTGQINQSYYNNEQKGLSITSMVLGILSTTCCCGAIGVLMGIAAIILGIIGRPKGGRGMALAGIICGSVGILVSLIYLFLLFTGALAEFISFPYSL